MPGLRNIEEYMDLIKDLGVEVYKDAARPAVSEVGAVAGRTVKALLAPIRGFLWCWEKIEDYVEKEVQKRLDIVVGGCSEINARFLAGYSILLPRRRISFLLILSA